MFAERQEWSTNELKVAKKLQSVVFITSAISHINTFKLQGLNWLKVIS